MADKEPKPIYVYTYIKKKENSEKVMRLVLTERSLPTLSLPCWLVDSPNNCDEDWLKFCRLVDGMLPWVLLVSECIDRRDMFGIAITPGAIS